MSNRVRGCLLHHLFTLSFVFYPSSSLATIYQMPSNGFSEARRQSIDQISPTSLSQAAVRYSESLNQPKPKTIYLIRHAESLENVAYQGARRVQASYASRSFPELGDVISALKLVFKMFRPSVMNAALSDLGETQVRQLHQNLANDNFLINDNDLLIAHSPLTRAKQTAYGAMFGNDFIAPSAEAPTDKVIVPLESLREVNPVEIITDALLFSKEKTVDKRIKEFEQWLDKRPEETIVVVGHSVYIKRMLKLPETFDNCDLWMLQYRPKTPAANDDESQGRIQRGNQEDVTSNLPRNWMSLKRLYRYTPEARPQLIDEEA